MTFFINCLNLVKNKQFNTNFNLKVAILTKISDVELKKYHNDGFLEIKNFFNLIELNKIVKKFKKIYKGEYSTNIAPDKRWWAGRNSDKIPRLLANAWKADYDIASIVLSKKLGETAALLSGWKSTRINEDSLIWVPPKSSGLSYHQDNSYHNWHDPGGVITAWIPLINTLSNGATLEYFIGSHKNKIKKMINYKSFKNFELDFKNLPKHLVNLNKGSVVFHHGNLWHGSRTNKTNKDRLALSIHFMNGRSKFHKTNNNSFYCRYKLIGSTKMLENFFPTTWSKNDSDIKFVKKFLNKEK